MKKNIINSLKPIIDKDLQPLVNKLSSTANKVANKIIKFTINKKRYKIMGRDSKALKLLNVFCKEKSSDFILKIFKKSKYDTFKELL